MTGSYILSIDQGTSSTKTIVFDQKGKAVARGSEPLKTHYYEGGFVEQDPEIIYENVLISVRKCLDDFKKAGGNTEDIKVCGISNQRETFVVWDKNGVPLYNAVVWQCKRSLKICGRLKEQGLEPDIKTKTGLIIDPYFSGTKLIWLKENIEKVRDAIADGNAYFGTVDTWLLYKLTEGKNYLTDYTNASRTLFFNLSSLQWDQELIASFGLSGIKLPDIRPSAFNFGETDFDGLLGKAITVGSMIGDSHAAAFGEGCFSSGTAKATLGTGCSIIMNIGALPQASNSGMMTTVCWSTADRIDFALEGVIVSCGATIEWLKNEMGLFAESRESEQMATSVVDNNGVYIIPAFSGLGAPHWQMSRKASISGLTFDCNKSHIVRAALESIPYQIKDVIVAMESDTGIQLKELMVNGGITSNRFVLQFLADLLDRNIANMQMPDVSALGAAYLAGLQSGIFRDLDELKRLNADKAVISPGLSGNQVAKYYADWKDAIGSL